MFWSMFSDGSKEGPSQQVVGLAAVGPLFGAAGGESNRRRCGRTSAAHTIPGCRQVVGQRASTATQIRISVGDRERPGGRSVAHSECRWQREVRIKLGAPDDLGCALRVSADGRLAVSIRVVRRTSAANIHSPPANLPCLPERVPRRTQTAPWGSAWDDRKRPARQQRRMPRLHVLSHRHVLHDPAIGRTGRALDRPSRTPVETAVVLGRERAYRGLLQARCRRRRGRRALLGGAGAAAGTPPSPVASTEASSSLTSLHRHPPQAPNP